MEEINYDSPQFLRAFLEARGLGMKKSFGQNFLINPGAREKILGILDLSPGETVWEIGPGLGAMTHMLMRPPGGTPPEALPPPRETGSLTVFEIDRGFSAFLREQFGGVPGFRLVEGDFLAAWREVKAREGFPGAILGNLPYNSGSVMIGELVKDPNLSSRMVFTLQKEVVQRICAAPGTEHYSGFSAICAFTCRVKNHGELQKGSFFPVPRVTSAIVSLEPRRDTGGADREIRELFFTLVNDGFASRRKTLRNNILRGELARRFPAELLLEALNVPGLSVRARIEELPLDSLAQICRRIRELGGMEREN